MTPIYYMTDADESGDPTAVNVSTDGKTVWLPETATEWTGIGSAWGEWTRRLVDRHADDTEDDGITPDVAARDAMRVRRVFEAVAAGRSEVDLDIDAEAEAEARDNRADARHGHPSLTVAERGVR